MSKWARENERFVLFAQRAYNARGGAQISVDGKAGEQTKAAYVPRVWPMRNLPDGREWMITSGYGMRGTGKGRHMHQGVDGFYSKQDQDSPASPRHVLRERFHDWWYPKGAEAIAAARGEVIEVSRRFYGMRVAVRDVMGDVQKYLHGYESHVHVRAGDVVELGAPIFVCGHDQRPSRAKSLSEPIHLHFEVWRDGDHIDPELWLRHATRLPAR